MLIMGEGVLMFSKVAVNMKGQEDEEDVNSC